MLPRLQAEESLIDAERVAVGGGHLKRGVATEVARRWQHQAAGPVGRRAQRATPEQLMAMGIGMTFVPPRGTEA